MAQRRASFASEEQCLRVGGNSSAAARSDSRMDPASSRVFPLAHSEARLALAMEPLHPNALNRACRILSRRTLSWIRTNSPAELFPAAPVPTSGWEGSMLPAWLNWAQRMATLGPTSAYCAGTGSSPFVQSHFVQGRDLPQFLDALHHSPDDVIHLVAGVEPSQTEPQRGVCQLVTHPHRLQNVGRLLGGGGAGRAGGDGHVVHGEHQRLPLYVGKAQVQIVREPQLGMSVQTNLLQLRDDAAVQAVP